MFTKQLSVTLMVCVLLFIYIPMLPKVSSTSNPIKVPEDYATIQEAINHAASGDTILVLSGTYCERLIIDKPLGLKGENKTNTIIDGNVSGTCIQINAANVVVTGFKIQNALIGILVQNSSGTQITENIITDTWRKSVLLFQSQNNTIIDNLVANNAEGIHLALSNNNTIAENVLDSNLDCGILLENSTNNRIRSNDSSANHDTGIFLVNSDNNIVQNNTVTLSNDDGMVLKGSRHNSLTGNTVFNNHHSGVYMVDSDNNTLSDNAFETNGWYGVQVYYSSSNRIVNNVEARNENGGVYLFCSGDNFLRNNTMSGNCHNFRVYGETLPDFLNDIDCSNVVDGKLLYYFVNQRGLQVPADAGYVGVVNCTDVRVVDLILACNGQGVLFAYTNGSVIRMTNLSKNLYGVHLFHSYNNQVVFSTLANNTFGFFLQNSDDNLFYFNNVFNSMKALVGNAACGNRFFRNNFVNQSVRIDLYGSYDNAWDSGFEGNLWGGYAGVDNDGDGIGDEPCVLDASNRDFHPLMRFCIPGDVNHDGTVNGTDADVLAKAWLSLDGGVRHNPCADLILDCIVNMKDAVFVGLNWEQMVP